MFIIVKEWSLNWCLLKYVLQNKNCSRFQIKLHEDKTMLEKVMLSFVFCRCDKCHHQKQLREESVSFSLQVRVYHPASKGACHRKHGRRLISGSSATFIIESRPAHVWHWLPWAGLLSINKQGNAPICIPTGQSNRVSYLTEISSSQINVDLSQVDRSQTSTVGK